jgi:hypothetical protein
VVLLSGPRAEGVHTARELAAEALRQGWRVSLFCAGDGTAHADGLEPLRQAGARVMRCGADAAVRGWDRPGTLGRGSFVDLGGMAADADRVLVL